MMRFPYHGDCRWQSAKWRTKILRDLMLDYSLSIHDVCRLTHTKYPTVACWRSSVDRPITAAHLKALIFEIDRGLV